MKVLLVIDTLGSGGKERRLTELLRALVSEEAVTPVLVVMSNDIHYQEIWSLGVEIHQLIRKTRKDISIFGKLLTLVRQINPDIVHCWDSMTAVYLAPVCKIAGYPLINGMVTNVPHGIRCMNYHWIRARLTFPFSRIVVSNSYAGLNAYRVPKRKRRVIPNGFDFSRVSRVAGTDLLRKELNIDTEFVAGMVASFSSQKDYPTFYRAAQLILANRNDVTFLVIGSGTDSEESVSLVDQQYKPYFRFLGKRKEVESYINLMDVCILATFTEGISNSIIEYMALAKPVVATIGGGTEELVNSGETGFLVRHADFVSLSSAIEKLLNNDDLRDKMGKSGRERIRAHFSIERMVDDYLSLYRQVALSGK